jgi:hypothetical protein
VYMDEPNTQVDGTRPDIASEAPDESPVDDRSTILDDDEYFFNLNGAFDFIDHNEFDAPYGHINEDICGCTGQ